MDTALATPRIAANPPAWASPRRKGRVLAALFLFVIVCGIGAQACIADRLVAYDDAGRTAAQITANPDLYRLAFAIFLVEMAAQMSVTVLFYELLKPAQASLARLSVVMGLIGASIKTFSRLFFYVPLLVLGGAGYLSAIIRAQLAALTLFAVKLCNQGAAIALVFFGLEGVLHGWLIWRLGFMPRLLGVLAVLGGLGWLSFLWPPLWARAFMLMALFAIVSSFITCGWLLVRGIDGQQWRQRTAAQ
jgi:hypothetical protein